jgi:hypothetical protein
MNSELIEPALTPEATSSLKTLPQVGFLLPEIDLLNVKEVARSNETLLRTSFLEDSVKSGRFENKAEALEALNQKSAEIKKSGVFLVISMTGPGFLRFMRTGQHDTFWDHQQTAQTPELMKMSGTSGVAHSEGYDLHRLATEEALALQVPPDYRGIHPNYAFMHHMPQEGGTLGSGPASYGNVFVRLAKEVTDAKIAYTFSDSLYAGKMLSNGHYVHNTGRVLGAELVPEAMAMMDIANEFNRRAGLVGKNLVRAGTPQISIDGAVGYVEAAIFDRVTIDQVDSVEIALNDFYADTDGYKLLPLLIDQIEKNGLEGKTSVLLPNRFRPLVKEWVAEHLQVADKSPSKQLELSEPDEIWSLLKIGPDSDYATVSLALQKYSENLVSQIFRYEGTNFSPPIELSSRRNYLTRLKQKCRLVDDDQKQRIDELISIEETRMFFQLSS